MNNRPDIENFDEKEWMEGRKNAETLMDRDRYNVWDKIEHFLSILKKMKNKEWSWHRNMDCKYVTIRVDMRTGHCIISDKEGNRISPAQLAWQYSQDTPIPPSDHNHHYLTGERLGPMSFGDIPREQLSKHLKEEKDDR